jgi:hypothetical protein
MTTRRVLSGVLLVVAISANPAAAEIRTWTDKTGKYTVEAEFIEILEGKVRLKLADGKIVALPLSKLAESDRLFLRDLLKKQRDEAAAAEAAANPPQPGANFPASERGRPRWAVGDRVQYRKMGEMTPATVVGVEDSRVLIRYDGAAADDVESLPAEWVEPLAPATALRASWSWAPPTMKPSIPPNYLGVKRLAPSPAAPSTLTPDPAPTPLAAAAALPTVRFGGSFTFWEKFVAIDMALGASPVAIAAYTGGKEMNDVGTRLEVVDMAASALRGNFSGPAKLKALQLSPSGNRLATRCEPAETWGDEFLDIWDLGEKGLTHVATWMPYANSADRERSIAAVDWVDDARVLTRGVDGRLIMWQIDGAKALYEVAGGDGEYALSPGRKQFAISGASGVDVYVVETGEHIAHLPTTVGGGRVAFSPSGRRLVVSGYLGSEVLDAQGQEPPRQFYMNGAADLSWIDDQLLLSGDGTVIDATKTAAVWRYLRSGAGWFEAGRFWYAVDAKDQRSLVSVVLPHDAAKQAAAAINPQDVYAVAPGMAVTLEVSLGDPTADAEATTALTAALQRAGLRVQSGSPITLRATTRGGDSQEMVYRKMFGVGPGGREEVRITVPTRYYDIELLVNGQKAFGTSRHQGPPMSPQLKEGESIQEVVSREMGVKASYVPTTIPMRIVKAEYQQPRGESSLTERGIEDGGVAGALPPGATLPPGGQMPAGFRQGPGGRGE